MASPQGLAPSTRTLLFLAAAVVVLTGMHAAREVLASCGVEYNRRTRILILLSNLRQHRYIRVSPERNEQQESAN